MNLFFNMNFKEKIDTRVNEIINKNENNTSLKITSSMFEDIRIKIGNIENKIG